MFENSSTFVLTIKRNTIMNNVTIEITGQISSCSAIKRELTEYKSVKGLRFGGYQLTYTHQTDAEADLAAAYENLTMDGDDATFNGDTLKYDAATAKIVID